MEILMQGEGVYTDTGNDMSHDFHSLKKPLTCGSESSVLWTSKKSFPLGLGKFLLKSLVLFSDNVA